MKTKGHSNMNFAINVFAKNLVRKSIKRNAHENQKALECEVRQKCFGSKFGGQKHKEKCS